jgi:glycosyltransferase involved in cell wall biosynthesis
MKIVHITPGSGGTFYCQNCFRDNELVKALQKLDHEVYNVPMYLPLNIDKDIEEGSTQVFYGAINVYLKEKIPLYRHAPEWMEKIFDSQPMLQFAAKMSGSTKAEGLEEMTISMLNGEDGRQASELERLIKFLSKDIKPDIVHLSNALLLGLAKRMKEDVGAKVICSLQDENEWIDPMEEKYRERVWNLMAEKAEDVDLFITSSEYYSNKSQQKLKIDPKKIDIVYTGINLTGYKDSSIPMNPPVIGYLCRMNENFGLDILVDAFVKIKNESKFKDLQLIITGGHTADDEEFVSSIHKKIEESGFKKDVKILDNFNITNRVEFLSSLTLLSVPVPAGEAFGSYQVEALASAVPAVQPNVGCYPEFMNVTKGGVIFDPNDSDTLAAEIIKLLADPDKIKSMGLAGKKIINEKFTLESMALKTVDVYEKALSN